MAKLQWPVLNSLKGFAEYLDKQPKALHWYRGSGTSTHPLLPSLFHRDGGDVEDLARTEKRLLTAFKQRSLPFLDSRPADDWEWLFLMQHYRLPTRLLDWTENPLIALYFALTKAMARTGVSAANKAAVWVLRPAKWNGWARREKPAIESVLSTGDDNIVLRGYAPGTDPLEPYARPLALSGIHCNARIAAQRGAFVVFGWDTAPMDSALGDAAFTDGTLGKVEFPVSSAAEVLESLTSMGITESIIYPDLEGLSKELRRSNGLEV